MNIYFQELKFYRRSTIIWMLVFAFGIFGYLSIFTSFTKDVESSKKILESLPLALRTALSVRLDTFFTIFGFFGYLLNFVWLVGSVQAMNLGTGILSKEISGKTADFLLTKPVSRFKVYASKFMAALTLIVLTNLVFIPSAYLSARYFSTESFDTKKFLLFAGTLFFVQIFFLGVGFLVSVVVPKIKSVIGYSLPIVFGFFIVGLLDSLIGTEAIRYLTPFKYFDPQYIIANSAYDWKYLLVDLAIVIACVVLGFVIYQRKEIQAAA